MRQLAVDARSLTEVESFLGGERLSLFLPRGKGMYADVELVETRLHIQVQYYSPAVQATLVYLQCLKTISVQHIQDRRPLFPKISMDDTVSTDESQSWVWWRRNTGHVHWG